MTRPMRYELKCIECSYSVPTMRNKRETFLCLWTRQTCKKACIEWTPKWPDRSKDGR